MEEPICLVCPIISDRFKITLSAAPVKTLYISLPKPASEAFPRTKPCLQNCSGGRFLTLAAPEVKQINIQRPTKLSPNKMSRRLCQIREYRQCELSKLEPSIFTLVRPSLSPTGQRRYGATTMNCQSTDKNRGSARRLPLKSK